MADTTLDPQDTQTAAEVETIVTLTPMAATKVRELLEAEGDPELALRVFVAGGGCSGLQYQMALTPAEDDDVLTEFDGVRLVVDPVSAQYIAGSEIDFLDGLMGAGFTVHNPNAVSSCGCGHSFRTADGGGEARSCGCGH